MFDAKQLVHDFCKVAKISGVALRPGEIEIDRCSGAAEMVIGHVAPSALPRGKMAVYVFFRASEVLKVGKVGPKSKARYTSQHYGLGQKSTLARSILSEAERFGLGNSPNMDIGTWIKSNVDRTNFLLEAIYGDAVLTLFEAFVRCRLNPSYEGFVSQRGAAQGFAQVLNQ